MISTEERTKRALTRHFKRGSILHLGTFRKDFDSRTRPSLEELKELVRGWVSEGVLRIDDAGLIRKGPLFWGH